MPVCLESGFGRVACCTSLTPLRRGGESAALWISIWATNIDGRAVVVRFLTKLVTETVEDASQDLSLWTGALSAVAPAPVLRLAPQSLGPLHTTLHFRGAIYLLEAYTYRPRMITNGHWADRHTLVVDRGLAEDLTSPNKTWSLLGDASPTPVGGRYYKRRASVQRPSTFALSTPAGLYTTL